MKQDDLFEILISDKDKLGKELILADEVTEIIADKVTTNQIKLPTFTLTLKL